MLFLRMIYLVFVICGICLNVGTAHCIPPNLPHMEITVLDDIRLQVKCDDSYKNVGRKFIYCVHNRLIGRKPICAKEGCPSDVIQPENGRIYVVLYEKGLKCKPDYIIKGNARSICNGTHWDRPLGECRLPVTETQYECDFESDLCDWTDDSARWTRKVAINELGSFSAGPTHDHTTMTENGGHYMVMRSGDLAGIDVPLFSPIYDSKVSTRRACFSFYYFMYGEGVAGLSVYIKPIWIVWDRLKITTEYLKFSRVGPQGMIWNRGFFEIPEMEDSFQIVIVAKTSKNALSDIAIDDVEILFGSECTASELVTTEPTKDESTSMKGLIDNETVVTTKIITTEITTTTTTTTTTPTPITPTNSMTPMTEPMSTTELLLSTSTTEGKNDITLKVDESTKESSDVENNLEVDPTTTTTTTTIATFFNKSASPKQENKKKSPVQENEHQIPKLYKNLIISMIVIFILLLVMNVYQSWLSRKKSYNVEFQNNIDFENENYI